MKKKIVVSVISDLVSDQRVHKVCCFLSKNFEVVLIGRKYKGSLPVDERIYHTERIYCHFKKGTLLYAEFMLKLFFKLLFKRANVFLANDLDTLLPNFLVAKLRSKKLVYDSHEYFTGVPELQTSPLKKKVWESLEKYMFPKIQYAYTVNESIAHLYKGQYGINMKVVRNVPYLQNEATSKRKHYPADKIILLLQGSGINEGRGAEELVESMKLLPDYFMLYLIGSGDCWDKLKTITSNLSLNNQITFIEKIPFAELRSYTQQAHLGISLDKPFCLNYELSLPNKVFDYIHAGIPILASSVIEIKKIIDTYKVGTTIDEITPQAIAKKVIDIFNDRQRYETWKKNISKAAVELCWEKEEKILSEVFNDLL